MRTRLATSLTVLIAAAVSASCATQAPVTSQQSVVRSAASGTTAATPTFYADVLPVLQENCQVCHIENGLDLGGMIAPMAFVTYDETRRYASRIARAVEAGYMPPWSAAPEQHGVFKNERILDPQDKETLLAWARGGTPAGDPTDAPAPRRFASSETGWAIGEPDLVIRMPQPYLVGDDIEDQYVDFEIEITADMLPEDRWVKAVEFRGGSSAVHHIIANPLGGIAPGVAPTVHEPGFGTALRTGTKVVFNMHYHKQTGPGTAVLDQSSAAIIFYEPGEVIEHVVKGNDLGMYQFKIPPNDPNYSFSSSYTFAEDAEIMSMTPHMHLRGKAALYTLTRPDGSRETLLDVPRYDFNWQHTYQFKEPVDAPAGSRVDLTLWWDNSADNPANPDPSREVGFGQPTTDEMGFGFMNFISAKGERFIVGEPIPANVGGSSVVQERPNAQP